MTMLMKMKLNTKNVGHVPDHSYRILIIGVSGSGNINIFLNLIENQPDVDKVYLHAKYPYEAKYQYLINIREKVGLKHFNNPKLLLSIRMICAMFTKIVMNTT